MSFCHKPSMRQKISYYAEKQSGKQHFIYFPFFCCIDRSYQRYSDFPTKIFQPFISSSWNNVGFVQQQQSMRVFLSTVNVAEQGIYCKRKLSFFIFSSYERSECFIFGVITENASQRNEMELLHLKRRFYEARQTAYEAQLTLHEAALRAMKRSLFRLHVFCLEIKAKKNGRDREIRTPDLLSPRQTR